MKSSEEDKKISDCFKGIVEAHKAISRVLSPEKLLNIASHYYATYIMTMAAYEAKTQSDKDEDKFIADYLSSFQNKLEKGGKIALMEAFSGIEESISENIISIEKTTKNNSSQNANNSRYKDRREAKARVLEAWDSMKANQNEMQLKKKQFGEHWHEQLLKGGVEIPAQTISKTWLKNK